MLRDDVVHLPWYRIVDIRTAVRFRRHWPPRQPASSYGHRFLPGSIVFPISSTLASKLRTHAKLIRTLTCYPCLLTAMHTHWFNHAFQIKHHHGLNSSSVTTTLAASRRNSSYTDFHTYWWAKRPI